MIKAVLFDMDGVLVDSEPFICKAAMMMFAELGHKVEATDFAPFVGAGENKYLGGVAEKYGIAIQIDEVKKRTYDLYDEVIVGQLKALPGVREFLSRCKRRSLLAAVATSADLRKLESNLGAIGLPPDEFDICVNGLEVTHRKPHPEIYLTAAMRLGVKPEECLVVEDALNGVEAASRAGCRCVALTTSFGPENFPDADWIVADLSQVPEDAITW